MFDQLTVYALVLGKAMLGFTVTAKAIYGRVMNNEWNT
jgi:hypothetical protein